MFRSLGLHHALRWFIIAAIVVAIWQGFNGNLGAMVTWAWHLIQAGAGVATSLWHSLNIHVPSS